MKYRVHKLQIPQCYVLNGYVTERL